MSNQTITAVFDSIGDAESAARDLAIKVGGVRAAIYKSQADASSLHQVVGSGPDRSALEEAIRRGGAVLSASIPQDRLALASEVIEAAGAVDLDAREASWRQSGWTGADTTAPSVNTQDTSRTGTAPAATAAGLTAGNARTTASASAGVGRDEVIPVVEESLRVGKRAATRGRVRVYSHIVETPVQEQVTLRQEHVQVERRPVDRPVDATAAAFQDRTIDVTETTEEAVVAKEARITEEVVVRKTSDEETHTINDTVRRTEVKVEDDRTARAGTAAASTTPPPSRER
jgi:uncharacterized protein (TIGR02271 family)